MLPRVLIYLPKQFQRRFFEIDQPEKRIAYGQIMPNGFQKGISKHGQVDNLSPLLLKWVRSGELKYIQKHIETVQGIRLYSEPFKFFRC